MLRHLWKHRCRAPLCSIAFLRLWAKRLLTFPTLLAMSAQRRRLMRRGATIGADACIGQAEICGDLRRLKIGRATSIGRAKIMVHDLVEIGSCVCINDGATLLTASHGLRDPEWKAVTGPVIIEDFAWVATRAMILPGVRIGRGAVVGAAAVVTRDVPAYAAVSGNPAQVRENRRTPDLRYSPVRFLAFQEAWLGPGRSGET